MPDIKTREVVSGTIKAVDRSTLAGQRMKDAYVRTKDKAEHGVYSAEGSAEEYAADLMLREFPDIAVGIVHGQMKSDEKDEVMRKFVENEYSVLVATTVIEVGVDVPNATVIVIENAERFGLSQLHQLRGRVGRSDLQSYCVLSSSTKSQETRARLDIMTQTNDGFVIAEKDLQLRGPGEFLGTRQSGLPDMIIADIVNDAKILELARAEAIDFVKNNKPIKIGK